MLRISGGPWPTLIDLLLLVLFVVVAAAPDFGFTALRGWPGVLVLAVLAVVSKLVSTMFEGTALAAYHRTLMSISGIISGMAGSRADDGEEPTVWADPNETIRTLLRRAKDFTVTTVRPPYGVGITANLLLPVFDEDDTLAGLQATHHDDFQPDRTHEVIPLDTPGAAEAFSSGVPRAVPFTDEVDHPRIRNRHYKSVAAFPVVVGEPSKHGRVVAVLSLDSTIAYTFDQKAVEKKLLPFVSPVAQLIGLALELRQEKEVAT